MVKNILASKRSDEGSPAVDILDQSLSLESYQGLAYRNPAYAEILRYLLLVNFLACSVSPLQNPSPDFVGYGDLEVGTAELLRRPPTRQYCISHMYTISSLRLPDGPFDSLQAAFTSRMIADHGQA